MSHSRVFILLLLLFSVARPADNPPRSGMIDTIAPVVSAHPEKRHHTGLFHLSFKSSEAGRIWYGIGDTAGMKRYDKPVTMIKEGRTPVYFYAEDLVGNRSGLDSAFYTIDTRAPQLSVEPRPGHYRRAVTVRLSCDEPCKLLRSRSPGLADAVEIADSFVVTNAFTGFITAIDRAGNKSQSEKLVFQIDTSSITVKIDPAEGVFNTPVKVSFSVEGTGSAFYSFDPVAPPEWFTEYEKPVELPVGLTVVRYMGRTTSGNESSIRKAVFVVDTIAPRVRIRHARGRDFDTLHLYTKEKTQILYSLNEQDPITTEYTGPIAVPRRGKGYCKAIAVDRANNVSEMSVWEQKYDQRAPSLQASHSSGTYTRKFTLTFSTSEPAQVFYTLDGSEPSPSSLLYKGGIEISKHGTTEVRYLAVDEAGNMSPAGRRTFLLDIEPPTVKARIDGNVGENSFTVSLTSSENARIHYERGGRTPSRNSPVYRVPLRMRSGQSLRYFAVDSAGNQSEVYVMNELQRPMVTVAPQGGVYTYPLALSFETNMNTPVFWRILPDTVFKPFKDSLNLTRQGMHTVEYYTNGPGGMRSPVRREEFVLDWTAPHTEISVKKGMNDSLIVFFECTENATIYYTTDGSSPLNSPSTNIAGNKLLQYRDRITIPRTEEGRLAFFTEDAAGNQSAITVLDIFRPHAIPNLPAGTSRVYDQVLSVTLNTYDDRSQIYYERHGKTPTLESPRYSEPITLPRSDTICAFVVDASGFQGEIDTFTYLIDLPPAAAFFTRPDTAEVERPVTFDASQTIDYESPISGLKFAWDFDGDGKFDARREGDPTVHHRFESPGRYSVTLQVEDARGRTHRVSEAVLVNDRCPSGMVFVPMPDGHSFCIDRFEWPNRKGKKPIVNVSWIQAKMQCLDAGKRLCTQEEWEHACSGGMQEMYPYGHHYDPERCPTEGEDVFASGSYSHCGEGFGLYDMVGNAWEWVDDRREHEPRMVGGAVSFRENAHCGQVSEGTMISSYKDVGFRCCK